MKDMKAVILHGVGDVRTGEFPTRAPEAGEVKVAVAYCGICGSDFHKFEGKQNTHAIHYPVPLGHEISGVICEVGEKVTDLAVGDRVTVDPNWSCGACRYCREGRPSFCENARGVVKGMAEYVVAPRESVYRLPDGLSLRAAALTEPLSCCLHGMDLLELRQGESAALVGFGAIGAMMLALMRRAGAGEITVIEPNEERRTMAIEMGATRFLSPTDREAVEALSREGGVMRVMECVGSAAAQTTALTVAGKGATVVLFGVSDAKELLPFSVYDAFRKELTVKTSFVNPFTTGRAIELLASGLLEEERLIAGELSMEEAAEEIRAPKYSRRGKVLVRIRPE